MKKLITILLSICQIPVFAQNWDINFDDTINANLITISPDSVWQIGHPNKVFFDSALSNPNAIATKLDTLYPSNTNTFFEMKFANPSEFEGYFGVFNIYFWNKYDLDSLHAGRWISVSIDNGLTFHSSTSDAGEMYHSLNSINPYQLDTLYNGELGLTGKSDFVNEQFTFIICDFLTIDTFIVRFNMASDSTLNTTHEGWLIDNMQLEFSVCSGVKENLPSSFTFNYLPNPDHNFINLSIDNPKESNLQIKVTDILGKTIIERQLHGKQGKFTHPLSIQDITEGLYIISVSDGNDSRSKKVLIEK